MQVARNPFALVFLRGNQLATHFARIVLRLSSLGDVNARADVAKERAVVGKTRDTRIQNPAICAITSSQAVFHAELLPRFESIRVNVQTAGRILLVYALSPAGAQLLFQRA